MAKTKSDRRQSKAHQCYREKKSDTALRTIIKRLKLRGVDGSLSDDPHLIRGMPELDELKLYEVKRLVDLWVDDFNYALMNK